MRNVGRSNPGRVKPMTHVYGIDTYHDLTKAGAPFMRLRLELLHVPTYWKVNANANAYVDTLAYNTIELICKHTQKRAPTYLVSLVSGEKWQAMNQELAYFSHNIYH